MGAVGLSFSVDVSDRTEVSTSGFPILCYGASLLLLLFFHVSRFFVPTNPRFISLFSLSVRAAEAAVRYCFALSPPNPTSALPHNCHNNSIHSSLFIQYCHGRLILTVGVKTYIIDIKHPHPRHSKRWSWQTTTIAYRQNELFVWVWPQYSAHRSSGLLGFGTVAAINIWIFRKQLIW